MEIITLVLFLYPVIVYFNIIWNKSVKVVINMCSHFHFIYIVWRHHDVHKPIFFETLQKPTIILNCTKHAVKENSCVCVIRKGSVLYFRKSYLFICIYM